MAQLPEQDWLTSSATKAVMAALAAAGGADCARFVGGCVRNAVLGQPVDDIDIATRLTPQEVVAALKAAQLRAIPTGIEHGTVTGLSERQPFEITTLRRDVETDGRHAKVAFTTDWAEDAARRDFRLNALYADGEGRIFDPTGQGYEDALAGRIIFVGEADRRIEEDYLRILRFFRFHAWYGRGAADEGALAACAKGAAGIASLSAERVSKELLKLLKAADPRGSVRLMDEVGVLEPVLGSPADLGLFEAMVPLSPDPLLRLSALWPQDGARVEALARGLRLSNLERERLVAAVSESFNLPTSDAQMRASLYGLGVVAFQDRVRRAWAKGAAADVVQGLLDKSEGWSRPTMPVGGRDLARLGIKPSPATGRILKAFEAEWVAEDFPESGHEARLIRLADQLS